MKIRDLQVALNVQSEREQIVLNYYQMLLHLYFTFNLDKQRRFLINTVLIILNLLFIHSSDIFICQIQFRLINNVDS